MFFSTTTTKNHKTHKETEDYGPFKEENKLIQCIPKEAQMSDLLDKDVKPTKLKLLKELKEDMDKDRKGSYE